MSSLPDTTSATMTHPPNFGAGRDPSLPDVNALTNPYEVVQRQLDRVAYFHLFAVAEDRHVESATLTPDAPEDWFGLNGGYGLVISSVLHRFDVVVDPPDRAEAFRVDERLREPIGRMRSRWFFGTEKTHWAPGQLPPSRLFDPWRPERFVALDTSFELGRSRFRGYALGRTYPAAPGGRPQLLVTAIGNLVEGSDQFRGVAGTFVLLGSLTPRLGFQGNVTCRIIDPDGRFASKEPLRSSFRPSPGWETEALREDAATYIVMRGEKRDPTVLTEYGPPPRRGLVSLVTPSEMKAVHYTVADQGDHGLRTHMEVGDVMAHLSAAVALDILSPPGTADRPNDFWTTDVYTFVDRRGRTIGTITARVEDGKSFDLKFPEVPDQPAMRYGGMGPIVDGTGIFEGVQGTYMVNSAIGVAPHALSLLDTLRIVDPDGRFRTGHIEVRDRTAVAAPSQGWQPQPTRVPSATFGLPDINAGTYPFDRVLSWLDTASYFNLFLSPARGPGNAPVRGGGQILGFTSRADLRRLVVAMQPPARGEAVRAWDRIGEVLGNFEQRWMFVPDDFAALPGREPPPTALARDRAQRFVMLDGLCQIAGGRDGFRGFGTGQTMPIVARGRRRLLAAAVGNVTSGFGRLKGMEGTYTLCGDLDPEGGFSGNLVLRFSDYQGALRADAEPDARDLADLSGHDLTYLLIHGQKHDRSEQTTYSFGPDDKVNGLIVHQELRGMKIDVATADGRPRAFNRIERAVLGRMSSNVLFNILDPGAPGTALSPIPFRSLNEYTFLDESGQIVGTVAVDGGEGRTFNMTIPELPGQRGLRFGVFGALERGTGCFEGVRGFLTDNSAVSIAPHVVSTLYVMAIYDPEGRFRARRAEPPSAPRIRPANEEDPRIAAGVFAPLMRTLDERIPHIRVWREQVRRCAGPLASTLADSFNRNSGRTPFPGPFPEVHLDRAVLEWAFRLSVFRFDEERFNRYKGPARGTFQTYEVDTGRASEPPSVLHSVWEPQILKYRGWSAKRITGANAEFLHPNALPPLEHNRVDLLVNAHHPEVGVANWVSIYQAGRRERHSIAYGLTRHDEVLWFVKDISQDGKPLPDDVFMASYEWKELVGEIMNYFLVGMFFRVDFDRCQVVPSGNSMWKARYEEVP